MGRSPCCDKVGLKKGPWTPEEDQKLLAYIEEHGHGSWRALPGKADLQRCGKSCRLRWTNYLRPDIKRGKFSFQEEQTIIQLHALLGNRWSAIATHLPKRTDNEIKNYWNTHLKKRLTKMGIDPVTHKPKNDALLSSDGQSKNSAKLSHMAQWESARLEAEARLVRESKLRSHSFQNESQSSAHPPSGLGYPGSPPAAVLAPASASAPASAQLGESSSAADASSPSRSLDVLRTWGGGGAWPKSSSEGNGNIPGNGIGSDLESPTSSLTFSECAAAPPLVSGGIQEHPKQIVDFVATSGSGTGASDKPGLIKEEGEKDWKGIANSVSLPDYKEGMVNSVSFTSTFHDMAIMSLEGAWTHPESMRSVSAHGHVSHVENEVEAEGFTNLLLNSSGDTSLDDGSGDSDDGGNNNCGGSGSDCYEDNKNYWNSILNSVNSSPSQSPMF